jgi:MscS family membrane protein
VEESHSARALLALAVRAGKILVLAVGLVSALSQLGYPVAGLIAGLGVGGLAVALAAQKTVENLFGSISLAVDQPFRVGDFVKVEDFTGMVEMIGLRSTRFRTLDRTIVTVPNGRLADMRIESFAPRDRLRLAFTAGLVYGTTAAQVREIVQGFEAALRAQPKLWPDALTVRLKEITQTSLDIEVQAWFTTTDFPEFQGIRQELLLGFLALVEGAGTSFAVPTRAVHVHQGEPLPVGKPG